MSAPGWLVTLAAVALAVAPSLTTPAQITLATNMPSGTTWFKGLLDMGDRWRQDTQGRVRLNVPAGGVDEDTAIKKMRSDVFQAAFLTPAGLGRLDDSFNVFSIPFFLDSTDEEAAVAAALTPLIERRLQSRGFHLLCWGNGGWVQLFSKKPLHTLAEVKRAKLFTSKGDDRWTNWYVEHGFNPVPLTLADIPSELKKPFGLIDTAPSPPYGAQALQFFRDAKYMLDIRIAPFTGALVFSNAAWSRLSIEDRATLSASAQVFEQRVRIDALALDAASIKAMQGRGLEVIPLDAKAAGEFRAAGTELVKTMRGGMVPADIYDAAVKARDDFRKSRAR
jgi:TRAP-type transport system periplasmic protein